MGGGWDWQGIAAVIAAFTSLVTAIGGIVLAIRAKATTAHVAQVAETVNGARAAMLARINSLTALLTRSGVTVPPDPNLPEPPHAPENGRPYSP